MSDVIRDLMRVAHAWANEEDHPDHGRSDSLEIALRQAFAKTVTLHHLRRGGVLISISMRESPKVPDDEIHVRDGSGRLLARVFGVGTDTAHIAQQDRAS